MGSRFISRDELESFLLDVDRRLTDPETLYLVGETTQLCEGWRPYVSRLDLAVARKPSHESELVRIIDSAAAAADMLVELENPGDVIPLPEGHTERHRFVEVDGVSKLSLRHFDPYSVAIRYIARGDEPDYHLALMYIEHGWVVMEEMERLLGLLLPRFSFETIQQDAAEFRRKYKGLLQMHAAVRPLQTHRSKIA